MFKNKKSFLLLAAMLVFALVLVGCADDDDNGAAEAPDTTPDVADEVISDRDDIRIAFSGNITSLDPHRQNETPASQVHRHVFQTLIVQDAEFNLHPGLAHDWEFIEDHDGPGDLYRFHIRDDVFFHNGDQLTAYDVAFTLRRGANAPHVAPIIGMIDPDTIVVEDDHTLLVGTEMPFAPFLAHLAHAAAGIMNESVVGDLAIGDANDIHETVVGTGPYRVTAWEPDNYIILERWDDFHDELPRMRTIYLDINADPQNRLFALEAGEVDFMLAPNFSDVEGIRNNPNITLWEERSVGIEFMGMNFTNQYLGIKEVRQAINYAVDVPVIVDVATEGTGNALRGPIPSNVFCYDERLSNFERNVERAKELLAEVGLQDGFEIELMTNSGNNARLRAAEIIQSQLADIGITATINQAEWTAYLEALDSNNFDAYFGGWGIVTGDADYALYPLFQSEQSPASNRVHLASPRVDELLEAGRAAQGEERSAIYFELLELLHEYAPKVFLQNNQLFIATSNNLRGFVFYPHQGHFFGDMYFVE